MNINKLIMNMNNTGNNTVRNKKGVQKNKDTGVYMTNLLTRKIELKKKFSLHLWCLPFMLEQTITRTRSSHGFH